MNFKEVRLPAGDIPGMDIGYMGSTGNPKTGFSGAYRDPSGWAAFDALHLIGHENGTRIISSTAEASLWIGRQTRHLKMSAAGSIPLRVHNSISPYMNRAVYAGPDASNRPPGNLVRFTVEFEGVEIHCNDKGALGQPARWGFFGNQVDRIWTDVTVYGANLSEHPTYIHACAHNGARLKRVTYDCGGFESDKNTHRPHWSFYPQGFDLRLATHSQRAKQDSYLPVPSQAAIAYEDCYFYDWDGINVQNSGAGMTFQGVGCNVTAVRCLLVNRNASFTPAIAFDDSGWEHYQHDPSVAPEARVAGRYPAMGHAFLKEVLAWTTPGDANTKPIFNISSLTVARPPFPGPIMRSLTLEGCGFYGENRYVNIPEGAVEGDRIRVVDCNSPRVAAIARANGIDTTHEAVLQVAGKRTALSAGYVSGDWSAAPQ